MQYDGGEGSGIKGHTTERTVRVSGNTYAHKEALKSAGYQWQAANKVWEKQAQVPSDLVHTAESRKLPEGHPDRIAQAEARKAALGPVMFKDVRVASAPRGGLFQEHHLGSEMPGQQPERSSVSERNRAMHEALGHGGYQRIPGSAPDDWH